jgi:hypothetical protein
MNSFSRIVGICAITAGCVSAQSNTGSIQGNVDDDQGSHVKNAYIVASPRSIGGGLTLTTMTDTNGAFTLSGMKPGLYAVCVQYPGDPHLDPCAWSTPPQVNVSAGAIASVVMPKIVKGSLFALEIDDPNRLWAAGDDFLVGVTLPTTGFRPLRLATSNPAVKTYDVAVPFDTPLVLYLSSTHLVFADDKGNALGHTASIPFKHVTGGNNARLVINVTGRN